MAALNQVVYRRGDYRTRCDDQAAHAVELVGQFGQRNDAIGDDHVARRRFQSGGGRIGPHGRRSLRRRSRRRG